MGEPAPPIHQTAHFLSVVREQLLVVRERKVDKFGGVSVSRLGCTMVDVLHESQRFFVAINQRQRVLNWNDGQQLKCSDVNLQQSDITCFRPFFYQDYPGKLIQEMFQSR